MILTKEDYFEYSGIDLNLELRNMPTDNPSRAVDIFLKNEEQWLKDVLVYFFDNTEEQVENIPKDKMKRALCYQIDYIRRNGLLRYDIDFKDLPLDRNARMVLRGYTNMARDGSRGVGQIWH